MSAAIVVFSVIVILLVLHDAFETMLLPRRISRQFRFARFFFQSSWKLWAAAARRIQSAQEAQYVPQSVWAAVVLDSHEPVGLRPDRRFRLLALGAGHGLAATGGGSGLSGLSLHERGDFLHARLWRRHAGLSRSGACWRCSRRASVLRFWPW